MIGSRERLPEISNREPCEKEKTGTVPRHILERGCGPLSDFYGYDSTD
jgi:hypothetical protein